MCNDFIIKHLFVFPYLSFSPAHQAGLANMILKHGNFLFWAIIISKEIFWKIQADKLRKTSGAMFF